jgi:RNA polymerase sigma-70 factor (ECF subfamily)
MSNKQNDKDLIVGCLKNNRRAQEMLYKRYFPSMMRMCLRYTKDLDRASMIVNDGFLKVFKKMNMYGEKGSLEGWIRKLVFHSLSDHFRKESKHLKHLIFDEREKQYQQGIVDELYLEDLLQIIDRLPGRTQKVFRLYAIEGYTHNEIGELLEMSDGTSKWHLSEARKKLKKLIISSQTVAKSHG